VAQRLAVLTRGILGCSRVSISAIEGEPPVSRPVVIVGLTLEQERQWWREQLAQSPQQVGAGLMPEDRTRLLAGEALAIDLTRPPYLIPNAYDATAVLAAPMRTQGRLVGLLGLDFQDPGNRPHAFTAEEIQIAEAVARLGAVVLDHERLLREREAARAEALALTEANRRMDEFLGIAGHELRTPLTTVKANLQLAERRMRQAQEASSPGHMARDNESRSLDQAMRLLERATLAAERQERLVQDLLDVSRISSGQLEYRAEANDLATIVGDIIEEQRAAAPDRTIALERPNEPVPVMADADRLGQVVANYLTNALKYSMRTEPIVIRLSVANGRARAEVSDRGPGLTSAQQEGLFERFHRVPGIEQQSGSGVGLGLGLYISRTIIERHGGTLGVTSAPGEGSTFWFELPLTDGASQPTAD
jgi:signal transduction histidine kinase